uniref:MCP four helix bundle domain-containing protein n=2 Tax=Thermodesulfovibrio TaxID=28261 RepID=UPI002627939F
MFKNMTLGKKLGGGFGVIIFFTLIMGSFIFIQLSSVKSNVDDIEDRVEKINYAASIRSSVKDILMGIRDILLNDDRKIKEEKKLFIEKSRNIYRESLEKLEKRVFSDTGKKLISELKESISDAASANNKVIELSLAGKNKEAIELFNRELPKKVERINKAVDAIVNYQYELSNKKIEQVKNSVKIQIITAIAISTLSTAIAVFFALLISRSVKKPVAELKTTLEKVAQGDLSVEAKVESRDELGMISQSV